MSKTETLRNSKKKIIKPISAPKIETDASKLEEGVKTD